MSAILEALDQAIAVVRTGGAPDIDAIYNRTMAHNQSFTVCMIGMDAVGDVKSNAGLIGRLVTKYGVPMQQVKVIAKDLLSGAEDMLRRRYGLPETAALTLKVTDALQASDSVDEWVVLLRKYKEYLNYLAHGIAVRIPWHELAVAFEGVRTVHKGFYDRLVD